MADATLKERITDVLRTGYFSERTDVVDVSDSDADGEFVHVVIISPKFEGRRFQEKVDLIWSELVQRLSPDEWGCVTLSVGVSPSEVNGATIDEIKAR